jgi:hypothetical protein
MSSDIQSHVFEKLSGCRVFLLLLDESTDRSQKCQLLSYIRFVDQYSIIEQFFSFTCRWLVSRWDRIDDPRKPGVSGHGSLMYVCVLNK